MLFSLRSKRTAAFAADRSEDKPQPQETYAFRVMMSDLSDGVGQNVDNLLVGCGHDTLTVDLYDAVAHPDSASFGDAPTHKAANLWKGQMDSSLLRVSQAFQAIEFSGRMQTNNAILDAEAQLVAEVGPSDEYSGDWRASDNVELDPRLVLQTLRQDTHARHYVGSSWKWSSAYETN